ncbi:MAG: hypothetical protein M1281_14885 [Chloroflexi bacterium]|nr:hypothetical protein [Chloroflexota bacterium]
MNRRHHERFALRFRSPDLRDRYLLPLLQAFWPLDDEANLSVEPDYLWVQLSCDNLSLEETLVRFAHLLEDAYWYWVNNEGQHGFSELRDGRVQTSLARMAGYYWTPTGDWRLVGEPLDIQSAKETVASDTGRKTNGRRMGNRIQVRS